MCLLLAFESQYDKLSKYSNFNECKCLSGWEISETLPSSFEINKLKVMKIDNQRKGVQIN